jgi:hypothetical protein
VLGGFDLFFCENQQFRFFITKCENQFGSCLLSFLETVNVLINLLKKGMFSFVILCQL